MPNSSTYSTEDTLSRAAHEVSEGASRLSGAAAEQVSDLTGRLQSAANQQHDRLERAIRRNPGQSALIAAGIGFVLAALARR